MHVEVREEEVLDTIEFTTGKRPEEQLPASTHTKATGCLSLFVMVIVIIIFSV